VAAYTGYTPSNSATRSRQTHPGFPLVQFANMNCTLIALQAVQRKAGPALTQALLYKFSLEQIAEFQDESVITPRQGILI